MMHLKKELKKKLLQDLVKLVKKKKMKEVQQEKDMMILQDQQWKKEKSQNVQMIRLKLCHADGWDTKRKFNNKEEDNSLR